MKKSEHGGAAFVTDIRRTLEPGADGQHTPYTWKRECSSRLLESRRFIQNVLDHSEKDIIFCLLLRKTREKPDYHE